MKISTENITFGMGGALLQKQARDTLKFAMKANARCDENNKWHDVSKAPILDMHKASKPGRLALIKDNNKFKTIRLDEFNKHNKLGNIKNELVEVYKNGKILINETFQTIRDRANSSLK